MRRGCAFFLLFGICGLLSGCWSSSAIEDLNMEVAVALDIGDETGLEKEFQAKGDESPKHGRVSSTYQFIVPQGSVGSKKEGAQSRNFYNMTETSDSLFEAIRQLSLRTNRAPIGHHLKVIVIGEKLARRVKLTELIDFFSRDNDIRPSVLILVSKGEAREVLNSALPGQTPAFVLEGIFNNRDRNLRIWEPVSMAKVVGPLHGKTTFLLQNVIAADNEMKFAGAGVIDGKTGKLSGFLDERELEGAVWLTGKGKGGLLKAYRNADSGEIVTYEVKSMSSKIRAEVSGDQISFKVHIKSAGRYAENFAAGGEKLDQQLIKKDESLLEEQVTDMAQSAVQVMQKLHADAAGFGKSLHIQHPAVWNRVKENWGETFSTIPVTYEVKLNIEEYGASETTTE